MKLIKKGAEADICQTTWNGQKSILKIRKTKNYRNLLLDKKIRHHRTVKEAQMLSFVKSFGIPVPLVYFVNLKEFSIVMQQIPGTPVHDLPNQKIVDLSKQIGRLAGIMHKHGVMHGDLTTSNFIFFQKIVYVIDFGLSQNSIKPEDHAVDLRLIKEILNSAHAKIRIPAWKNFLLGYRYAVGSDYCRRITKIVSDIESRGRYAEVV